jgi:hypothetical protein
LNRALANGSMKETGPKSATLVSSCRWGGNFISSTQAKPYRTGGCGYLCIDLRPVDQSCGRRDKFNHFYRGINWWRPGRRQTHRRSDTDLVRGLQGIGFGMAIDADDIGMVPTKSY